MNLQDFKFISLLSYYCGLEFFRKLKDGSQNLWLNYDNCKEIFYIYLRNKENESSLSSGYF